MPVVASDVGGLGETVVDGITGLLVPPGDPAGLAAALVRLLSDAELNERLGAQARGRYLSDFTLDRMTARLARWPAAWSSLGRSQHVPPVVSTAGFTGARSAFMVALQATPSLTYWDYRPSP